MIDNKDYDAVEIINIHECFSDKRLFIDDCNHIDFHRCLNGYIHIDEVVIEDKVMFRCLVNALVKYAEDNLCTSIIYDGRKETDVVLFFYEYGFTVEGVDNYNICLKKIL